MNKKEKLLRAIEEMKKESVFEDNLHKLLKADVYELQPFQTSGYLFDIVCDILLTEDGNDLVSAFMFDLNDHDEENPLELSDGTSIATPQQLCDYIEKNNLFL